MPSDNVYYMNLGIYKYNQNKRNEINSKIIVKTYY